jgi:hypothetical protein
VTLNYFQIFERLISPIRALLSEANQLQRIVKDNYQMKILITMFCLLSISGCATTLPTFAHVHVGHALSGWPDTPGNKGLFAVSEDLAVDIVEVAIAASELSRAGQHQASVIASSKLLTLIGTPDDDIQAPENYTFLAAFVKASNHLKYSIESKDATANLSQGLTSVVDKGNAIVVRANVLKELATVLASLEDQQTIVDVVQQLREIAIQNLEGGDGEYSLRDMRNELSSILAAENPAYSPPERKYLFGLLPSPNGGWFWSFKEADDKGSYGRYSY